MNIFMLSWLVSECAKWHFDKHVVKMILETAQLLSSAHHVLDPDYAVTLTCIYRKTHANHPCAQWVRAHVNNYTWVCKLGLALCAEYTRRYGKVHKSQAVLECLQCNPPPNIACFYIVPSQSNPKALTLPIPQAMPEEYRVEDARITCSCCNEAFRVLQNPLQQIGPHVVWQCTKCNNVQETQMPAIHVLDAYRAYYQGAEKRPLAVWKHEQPPHWFL